MSSTSTDVCELWNGKGISRVQGSAQPAPIIELYHLEYDGSSDLIPEEDPSYDEGRGLLESWNSHTSGKLRRLRPGRNHHRESYGDIRDDGQGLSKRWNFFLCRSRSFALGRGSYRGGFRKTSDLIQEEGQSPAGDSSDPIREEGQSPPTDWDSYQSMIYDFKSGREAGILTQINQNRPDPTATDSSALSNHAPPNLGFNISHQRVSVLELRILAAVGILLQTAVLVFAGITVSPG
jgi:hypothetical protein